MIYDEAYSRILKEHFDLRDRETLNIMTTIEEADGGQVLESLTGKLYQMIVDKVDDVDFGLIPESKGDITKVDGIERVIDSLDIMVNIMVTSRQSPEAIQIVEDCIKNIQKRTDKFTKAYMLNLEIPIMIYNTMVLSVISSTTFLIKTCIDFIKNPGTESYDIVVRNSGIARAKDALVMKNLVKFNNACKNGELDKVLDHLISAKAKGLTGATIVASITVLGPLILSIVPIMRELIYLYYHARVSVDDYLSIQANLIQMNAANLEHNDSIPLDKRQRIVKKQNNIADSLRKMANIISIKEKKAENNTIKTMQSENRLYRFSELRDEIPDSANSLF